MNEFLDSKQGSNDLEGYYHHFLTLLKYAPLGMSQYVKVAHFVIGLNPPLETFLQSLSLSTFADVLDVGKPIELELGLSGKRKGDSTSINELKCGWQDSPQSTPKISSSTLPPHLREKNFKESLCLTCLDPNNCYRKRPYSSKPSQNVAHPFQPD